MRENARALLWIELKARDTIAALENRRRELDQMVLLLTGISLATLFCAQLILYWIQGAFTTPLSTVKTIIKIIVIQFSYFSVVCNSHGRNANWYIPSLLG